MNQTFVRDSIYADYAAGKAPYPKWEVGCAILQLLLIIGGMLLIAIPLAANAWYSYAEFALTGVVVQARIIEKWETSDGEGRDYHVRVRYPAMDDHTYEAVANANGAAYNGYSVGDAFPIIYLPGQPATVRTIDDISPKTALLWTMIFIGTVIWAYLALKEIQKRKRLTEHGVKLLGIVTSAEQYDDSDGGNYICIHYQFQSPIGAIRNGSFSRPFSENDWLPESGTPIAIQYVDDRLFKVL